MICSSFLDPSIVKFGYIVVFILKPMFKKKATKLKTLNQSSDQCLDFFFTIVLKFKFSIFSIHIRCQICPYASRNSSQLIVHLRTHTGDSPFHCTICPAQFKINSDLKRHMRIHTGEKPFQCDKCDYKSSNRGKR